MYEIDFNKKNAIRCKKSRQEIRNQRKVIIATNKCFLNILGYSNIS